MSRAAPAHYMWWLAGRSAGMVALALITAATILGLAMAARVLPSRLRRDAVRAHQHLAIVALGAIAAHGLLLAADPWLKPGIKGVTVPFALGYRPLWTGLGILGGYLVAVFALSFYVRRKIGTRTWRSLHRFTALAYLLALAHAIGSGTDAAIPAVRYALLASALPVLALVALRVARARPPLRAPSSGVARSRQPVVVPPSGAAVTPRCVAAAPGTTGQRAGAETVAARAGIGAATSRSSERTGRRPNARDPTGRLEPTPSQLT